MNVSDLSSRIQQMWNRRFPDYDDSATLVRQLPSEAESRFRVVFHPSSLRLQPPQANLQQPQADCPLDTIAADVRLPFRDWLVTPNRFPVERDHILLVYREHRANLKPRDLFDGFAFAQETGYRLLLNLQGSGASLPAHLHWQGLRSDFPIFRPQFIGRCILSEVGLAVNALSKPWGGYRVEADNQEQRMRVAQSLAAWEGPFNLVLTSSVVYVLPRVREYASQFPSFKFGAAEVAGTMFAQNRSMFESVDDASFAQAVHEVAMNDEQLEGDAERLWNRLRCVGPGTSGRYERVGWYRPDKMERGSES